MENYVLSVKKNQYPYKNWKQTIGNGDATILYCPDVNTTWWPLLKTLIDDHRYKNIVETLIDLTNKNNKIYPYPELLYYAFKLTILDDLKVVILGQDPYFNSENNIPQAMGLSFSVPVGLTIPSSLDNIYKNMVKFNHINKKPAHGNLEFLAAQGCLFLNTALTVLDGQKNCHSQMWKWFTDDIIEKISEITNNIVFVLWGKPALDKLKLIDTSKHHIVISSHPSGLSCNKPLGTYPSFNDCDHFGEINKYLEKNGKQPIVYGIY